LKVTTMSAERADLERLFDPSATVDETDSLERVHAFIVRARDAYGRLPAPEPRADLSAWFSDASDRPSATTIALPSPWRVARPPRMRRLVALAATLLLLIVATAGLAAGGALPGGLQDAVSGLLDRVGIDVPRDTPARTPPSESPVPNGETPRPPGRDRTETTPSGSPGGAATTTLPATTTATTPPAPGGHTGSSGEPTPTLPEPPVSLPVAVPEPPVSLPPVTVPELPVPTTLLPSNSVPGLPGV
jgi:hypothetical protein